MPRVLRLPYYYDTAALIVALLVALAASATVVVPVPATGSTAVSRALRLPVEVQVTTSKVKWRTPLEVCTTSLPRRRA